jgi:hypothetical protein
MRANHPGHEANLVTTAGRVLPHRCVLTNLHLEW